MTERRDMPKKRHSVALAAVLSLIRLYQLTLSSLLGRSCRFLPSCSDYAREALQRHGLWRGGLLAVRRIVRCHPWGGSGFDPVPQNCEHKD
jgi:putative membrane protein insertion efficiency factor